MSACHAAHLPQDQMHVLKIIIYLFNKYRHVSITLTLLHKEKTVVVVISLSGMWEKTYGRKSTYWKPGGTMAGHGEKDPSVCMTHVQVLGANRLKIKHTFHPYLSIYAFLIIFSEYRPNKIRD